MPSAIEVHLGQVVIFLISFLNFNPKLKRVIKLSKFVKKYQNYTKSTKIIPGIPKLWLV